MKIFWLTLFAMVAFAANSVLTRYALALDQIGPSAFVAIRLMSGAIVLGILIALQNCPSKNQGSPLSAAMLLLYAAAFSFAYTSLDAGIGALILFGVVQITMFAGALMAGEKPSVKRWAGMGLGMAGLMVLFGPNATRPDTWGAALMVFSAIGWGVYSLRGKLAKLPLQSTGMNFILAAPFGILIWLLFPDATLISSQGVMLAIASGAVASGLGYAVWYAVLPKLDSSLAAIVQLTVPVIALAGGIVFLGEKATLTFGISSILILGGVALAVSAKR